MRNNKGLNRVIETFIDMWDGTIKGQEVRNMYENGTSYESICDYMDIDFEDYEE